MSAAQAIGAPSWRVQPPPQPGDPRAVRPLLEAADGPTKNARAVIQQAIWAIAKTAPGDKAIEYLVEALHDPRPSVRFVAARAYGGLPDRHFEPLVPLLHDTGESVRWAAASSLIARGGAGWRREQGWEIDPEPLLALRAVAEDPASTVRQEALEGLSAVGGSEGLSAARAGAADPDIRVRARSPLWLKQKGRADTCGGAASRPPVGSARRRAATGLRPLRPGRTRADRVPRCAQLQPPRRGGKGARPHR